jgi:hypothetical protein
MSFGFVSSRRQTCDHMRLRFNTKIENRLTHLFCLKSPSLLYAEGKFARAEHTANAAFVWKFCELIVSPPSHNLNPPSSTHTHLDDLV